jgi:dUTP pyrophosphatase
MRLPVRIANPESHPLTRQIPSRGSDHAAGLDLYAAVSAHLPKGSRAVIPTGIAIAIPEGYVGLVWPRSGLAVKRGLDVMAGVIDADYRGEVGVVLINHGQEDVLICEGERIAQLLIQPVLMAEPVEVSELPETDRGAGGFGSTGE